MSRFRTAAVFSVLLVLMLVPGGLAAQEVSPLVDAYQKEFIFLDNEIRLLRQRLEEVELDGERRVANAEQELGVLEGELLQLRTAVEERRDELRILEEEEDSASNASDTINSILTQANSRLDNFDIPSYVSQLEDPAQLSDSQQFAGELRYVFNESLKLLKDFGRVRTENGNFFLPDGEQVEGTIVKIGEIASFGTTGEEGGTLAPAGSDLLRLHRGEHLDTANALARGEQPEQLPMFLYESLENLVETSSAKTFADTIEGGGFIGIIILGLGAIGLVLIIFRVILLKRAGEGTGKDVGSIALAVEQENWDSAVTEAGKMKGALRSVLLATVHGLRTKPKKVEETIAETVLNEQPAIDRFRIALTVFAAVAPLLGLLGTVTGMIATFDIITIYGTGDPKLLSGGISEALITTQLGLMVAIPTLLIGNLLTTWGSSITSSLEVKALRLVNAYNGFTGVEKEEE